MLLMVLEMLVLLLMVMLLLLLLLLLLMLMQRDGPVNCYSVVGYSLVLWVLLVRASQSVRWRDTG